MPKLTGEGIDEGNGVKHQDLETISRLLVGEVQNSFKSELRIRCGRGSGHVLHPFLSALHTNLAADVAKLVVGKQIIVCMSC